MVTEQHPRKNGAELVRYILDDESHREGVERNLYVTYSHLIPCLSSEDIIKQFNKEWKYAKHGHSVQMRHMIFSPSIKEVPISENNVRVFGETVREFIEKEYPNRRALIGVQVDGTGFFLDKNGNIIRSKSGKPVRSEEKAKRISGQDSVKEEHVLHAHVALSDCDLDTYKGVPKEKTRFSFLRNTFDSFFVEKSGRPIDPGERSRSVNTSYLKNRLTDGVITVKVKNGTETVEKYVSYKDDLKYRIDKCEENCNSLEEFIKTLPRYGVKLRKNKYGSIIWVNKNHGEFVTYELVDQSRTAEGQRNADGTLKICALRSYNMNGYGLDDINLRIIARLSKKMAQKEQAVSKETPSADITASTKPESDTAALIAAYEASKQTDEFLMLRFGRLYGIDLNSVDRKTFLKNKEELSRLWDIFKASYPDDYKERLEKEDITLPNRNKDTSSTEPPVKDVKPAHKESANRPVREGNKPSAKSVPKDQIRSKKTAINTDQYSDLVKAYDALHANGHDQEDEILP